MYNMRQVCFYKETARMHRRDKDNMQKMSILLWTLETGMQRRKQCWHGELDYARGREDPNATILFGPRTASMGNKLLKNRFYYGRKQRYEQKWTKRTVKNYGRTRKQEVVTPADYRDRIFYWDKIFIT